VASDFFAQVVDALTYSSDEDKPPRRYKKGAFGPTYEGTSSDSEKAPGAEASHRHEPRKQEKT